MTTARRRRKSEKTEQALAVWRYETELEEVKRQPVSRKRSLKRDYVIFTALEWGATFKAAARLAGVSESSFHIWRRTDPDFAAKVRLAKERLQAKQREALYPEESDDADP